jgi:hypothetical protein
MFTFARPSCVFLLAASGLFAQTAVRPAQRSRTSGMIGVAQGQTARLNVLNPEDSSSTVGCSGQLTFFDAQGRMLKSATVTVLPGQSASLDVRGDSELALPANGRGEIRATITIPAALPPSGSAAPTPAPCRLIGTLEVFDTLSGQTETILAGWHRVGNPAATPVAASGGQ